MRRNLGILLSILALGIDPNYATADLITFDELDVSRPIPAPYFGMAWRNFSILETPFRELGSGYDNGVVSPPIVAFSRMFDVSSFGPGRGHGSFKFVSGEFTGAWHDDLTIEIQGLFDGAVVHSTEFIVDATGPTHVELNWAGIDTLAFRSHGGVLHDPDWLEGEMFVLDDVVVDDIVSTLIPEPAGWLLACLGLMGCLFIPRRLWRTRIRKVD